jgi:hypothetical protein
MFEIIMLVAFILAASTQLLPVKEDVEFTDVESIIREMK